eukprot:UN27587
MEKTEDLIMKQLKSRYVFPLTDKESTILEYSEAQLVQLENEWNIEIKKPEIPPDYEEQLSNISDKKPKYHKDKTSSHIYKNKIMFFGEKAHVDKAYKKLKKRLDNIMTVPIENGQYFKSHFYALLYDLKQSCGICWCDKNENEIMFLGKKKQRTEAKRRVEEFQKSIDIIQCSYKYGDVIGPDGKNISQICEETEIESQQDKVNCTIGLYGSLECRNEAKKRIQEILDSIEVFEIKSFEYHCLAGYNKQVLEDIRKQHTGATIYYHPDVGIKIQGKKRARDLIREHLQHLKRR